MATEKSLLPLMRPKGYTVSMPTGWGFQCTLGGQRMTENLMPCCCEFSWTRCYRRMAVSHEPFVRVWSETRSVWIHLFQCRWVNELGKRLDTKAVVLIHFDCLITTIPPWLGSFNLLTRCHLRPCGGRRGEMVTIHQKRSNNADPVGFMKKLWM